jgi:hypothetical protein
MGSTSWIGSAGDVVWVRCQLRLQKATRLTIDRYRLQRKHCIIWMILLLYLWDLRAMDERDLQASEMALDMGEV